MKRSKGNFLPPSSQATDTGHLICSSECFLTILPLIERQICCKLGYLPLFAYVFTLINVKLRVLIQKAPRCLFIKEAINVLEMSLST